MSDLLSRIETKIERITESGCWIWNGYINPHGYGIIFVHGKRERTHRTMYELLRGSIPSGLQLDHLCRVRCCVNPAHIEAVTKKVNVLRGVSFSAVNARKTHCPSGHLLEGDNLTADQLRIGKRRCAACKRKSSALRNRKKRAAIKAAAIQSAAAERSGG